MLTLLDGYTGARWSELISQQPGAYDQINKQFPARQPIREAKGKFEVTKRPKSKASKRWIQLPPILAGFTFHDGRHTQRTWLSEDRVADVAKAARLGHKLPGTADVYEHVTPTMSTPSCVPWSSRSFSPPSPA